MNKVEEQLKKTLKSALGLCTHVQTHMCIHTHRNKHTHMDITKILMQNKNKLKMLCLAKGATEAMHGWTDHCTLWMMVSIIHGLVTTLIPLRPSPG